MSYVPLRTRCDFSATSLADALLIVGPAFVYDVYVHPQAIIETRMKRASWNADVEHAPLAPYINLHTDESLRRGEWCVEANGLRAGSEGCW